MFTKREQDDVRSEVSVAGGQGVFSGDGSGARTEGSRLTSLSVTPGAHPSSEKFDEIVHEIVPQATTSIPPTALAIMSVTMSSIP